MVGVIVSKMPLNWLPTVVCLVPLSRFSPAGVCRESEEPPPSPSLGSEVHPHPWGGGR